MTDEFESLSPEQGELVVQLQDRTGLQDLGVCRALLESRDWDLEAVAREQLGQSDSEEDLEVEEVVRQPLDRSSVVRPAHSMGWIMYILTFPSRVFTSSLNIFWSFLSSLMPARVTDQTSGKEEVVQFCREFEQQYGTSHPAFTRLGYYQALEEAKRDLRFLLVYLHSEDHQDTDRFCSEVLGSQTVIQQIQDLNIMFWTCSVRRMEGYKVSQALRENSYPFLALIVLRQHRMVVVARQEGMVRPDSLTDWLRRTVTEYEAFIVAARADRDERNLDREIRNQQEAEYAETLRRDQEREERLREQAELERREEEQAEMLRREELEKKDNIVRMKIEFASEIPEEPEPELENVVRVCIKLPGGQRLDRRFLLSHSLKHIYYFVFCHPDSPDEFDIVTNYPKRTLQCKPSSDLPSPPTLKEAGFGKSEMLFVSDLDS